MLTKMKIGCLPHKLGAKQKDEIIELVRIEWVAWNGMETCEHRAHCAQHQFQSTINLYSLLIKQLSTSINIAAWRKCPDRSEKEDKKNEKKTTTEFIVHVVSNEPKSLDAHK